MDYMSKIYFGVILAVLLIFVISQFILAFQSNDMTINIIVDEESYNLSQYKFENGTIPYIQFECIKKVLERRAELYDKRLMMEKVCLNIGK